MPARDFFWLVNAKLTAMQHADAANKSSQVNECGLSTSELDALQQLIKNDGAANVSQ